MAASSSSVRVLTGNQSVWSAVTNRLILAGDGRSLQIDLVGGCWAIPVSDIPGSRESGASAPIERAPCPFRKSDPVWIRMTGQNHRIVESDVFDPAHARSIRCQPGQIPQPA